MERKVKRSRGVDGVPWASQHSSTPTEPGLEAGHAANEATRGVEQVDQVAMHAEGGIQPPWRGRRKGSGNKILPPPSPG
eukprot:3786219-Amphidinium_carterae.1